MNIGRISELHNILNDIFDTCLDGSDCSLSNPKIVNTVIGYEKELEQLYSITRH